MVVFRLVGHLLMLSFSVRFQEDIRLTFFRTKVVVDFNNIRTKVAVVL